MSGTKAPDAIDSVEIREAFRRIFDDVLVTSAFGYHTVHQAMVDVTRIIGPEDFFARARDNGAWKRRVREKILVRHGNRNLEAYRRVYENSRLTDLQPRIEVNVLTNGWDPVEKHVLGCYIDLSTLDMGRRATPIKRVMVSCELAFGARFLPNLP